MSTLSIYDEAGTMLASLTRDFYAIAESLGELGVQFERWQVDQPLAEDANQQAVLNAYRESVDRLNKQYGFRSVDVVSLGPDHPNKGEMRRKFLNEHRHADFEIRFFVDGKGLFYLHIADRIYLVLCDKGDLISVPANTTHWFDMGKNPDFKCIRFFTTEDGWEAEFTGSEIAKRFPSFDDYVARV
ncbi:MAG: 1,2-dihydroxy-3-keto-5-methylthiopentene dioxygenase [Methylococcales bacterium]